MYSRSYYDKSGEFNLPANYDGTAFKEDKNEAENATRPLPNPEAESFDCNSKRTVNDDTAEASVPPLGFLSGLEKGIFGGLFGGGLRLPRLGAEEILIIATALFLLFSKEGDIECSILLLLLLLIN